jgi:hypothetical protein
MPKQNGQPYRHERYEYFCRAALECVRRATVLPIPYSVVVRKAHEEHNRNYGQKLIGYKADVKKLLRFMCNNRINVSKSQEDLCPNRLPSSGQSVKLKPKP